LNPDGTVRTVDNYQKPEDVTYDRLAKVPGEEALAKRTELLCTAHVKEQQAMLALAANTLAVARELLAAEAAAKLAAEKARTADQEAASTSRVTPGERAMRTGMGYLRILVKFAPCVAAVAQMFDQKSFSADLKEKIAPSVATWVASCEFGEEELKELRELARKHRAFRMPELVAAAFGNKCAHVADDKIRTGN
jgi:hypothetical protein